MAKADEPGLTRAARELGVPLRSFPAAALAAVPVPEPSAAAAAAARTPSVAEAAALLAAGPGAVLAAGKRKSPPPARATCALAVPAGRAGTAVTDSGALTAGREERPSCLPPGRLSSWPPQPAPPWPGSADGGRRRPGARQRNPGSKEPQ
ncbi:cobalamin biosynthesis protein [Streptomyces lydicus]|nr:cobalamin biosynthesis protein [Streptomyces lydicus]